ncbi:hypothetical protein [Nocardioides sp.]
MIRTIALLIASAVTSLVLADAATDATSGNEQTLEAKGPRAQPCVGCW